MGRKNRKDEMLMAKVIDLSWKTLYDILKSEKMDLSDKLNVALQIAGKSIPKELKITKDPLSISIVSKTVEPQNILEITDGESSRSRLDRSAG